MTLINISNSWHAKWKHSFNFIIMNCSLILYIFHKINNNVLRFFMNNSSILYLNELHTSLMFTVCICKCPEISTDLYIHIYKNSFRFLSFCSSPFWASVFLSSNWAVFLLHFLSLWCFTPSLTEWLSETQLITEKD